MNIVIIGGGQKFGKVIADKFAIEGHTVFILSHKNYGSHAGHMYADFRNPDDVVAKFRALTATIETIDLLLYNTNADYGPCHDNDFCSTANLANIRLSWHETITIQATIPHLLAVTALDKMNQHSKIVFMTSDLAFSVPRNYNVNSVGHPGGKAAQTHLMFALANCNNKDAIVYSISTHFEYDNVEKMSKTVDKIFNLLKTTDRNITGRIIKFWN